MQQCTELVQQEGSPDVVPEGLNLTPLPSTPGRSRGGGSTLRVWASPATWRASWRHWMPWTGRHCSCHQHSRGQRCRQRESAVMDNCAAYQAALLACFRGSRRHTWAHTARTLRASTRSSSYQSVHCDLPWEDKGCRSLRGCSVVWYTILAGQSRLAAAASSPCGAGMH